MATISENLQTIKSSMSAIKQAISDKGGDVSGDISTWANTISNIEGGVSSGGGAYSEVNHGTSDTTFTLTPNTFHVWDEVSSLTLTLGGETSGVANEYLFQFTSGATATTLMLPDTIKWAGGSAPTIQPNMIYQISILNDLGSVLEFSNAVVSSIFPATLMVGDNGDLGVSVYETLSEGVVLQEGDLTLIIDGENYSITEYELDYDYSNGGLILLYLEDGPMMIYHILESSGEVVIYYN